MSNATRAHELGQLDAAYELRPESRGKRPSPTMVTPRAVSSTSNEPETAVPATLSLILPGAGQFVRGQWTTGMLFLTGSAFLVSLAWALLATLDRLAANLPFLGYSPALGMWALAACFAGLAALHVTGVYTASRERRSPPHRPGLPAVASMVLPGWGQLINGDRVRAALFLAGLWAVVTAWLLWSPAVAQVMERLNLYLPAGIAWLTTPLARWSMPAVVWALSVYDAAASAALRR